MHRKAPAGRDRSTRVGSRLATERQSRGHTVIGIGRSPANIEPRPGVTMKQGDATQPSILAPLIAGHDAVLSASRFQTSDANALITAAKKAGVKRLLVVGGAGTLEVAPGKVLVDTPDFPEAYKAEARADVKFLDTLRNEKDLDWTYLSPSTMAMAKSSMEIQLLPFASKRSRSPPLLTSREELQWPIGSTKSNGTS
jgi:putative NADH-flavin reductase